MGRNGLVGKHKKTGIQGEIWDKWGATYGRNGLVGKHKKTRIECEIWEKVGCDIWEKWVGCGGKN